MDGMFGKCDPYAVLHFEGIEFRTGENSIPTKHVTTLVVNKHETTLFTEKHEIIDKHETTLSALLTAARQIKTDLLWI